MSIKNVGKLAIAVLACQSAGVAGSLFVGPDNLAWYAQLTKPTLTPPAWLFGPVWIVLYALMGISLYLVWQKRTRDQCHCTALGLFLFQLALSALWPYLFFGLKEPLLSLFGMGAVLLAILLVIVQFWRISKPAAYLLLLPGAWITFAAYLNLAIWQLN